MKRLLYATLLILGLVSQAQAQIHQGFVTETQSAAKRECDANLRVLLGAVELYNMDHQEMIKELRDEDVQKGGKLVGGTYLKTPISKPIPECLYSSVGDISQEGHLTCKVHGRVLELDENNVFQEFRFRAEKLLAAGADINGKNALGQTVVHVTIEKDNPRLLEYLITKGADINLPDADGKTPLRLALDTRKLRMAQILQRNKALYDLDPARTPPMEQPPLLKLLDEQACLLRKSGDTWEVATKSLTLTSPTQVKTSGSGTVSLQLFSPVANGKLEPWGFTIFLHPETEVEIQVLDASPSMSVPSPLGINLLNGELTINRQISERTILFQAGTITVENLAGIQKVFYQSGKDAGEVVVKNGYAEVRSLKAPFPAEKVSGFYKVSLEKGTIGRLEQASIIEYEWPQEPPLTAPGE